MIIQTKNGYPEVVLMADCHVTLFHKTAEWLRLKMSVNFTNKQEEAEQISWKFQFASVTLLLQYDQQSGISVCPASLHQSTQEEMAGFKKFTDTLQYSTTK
jgi:hypothetical protein